MALTRTLNGDILHVVETIHGTTSTRVRHWYTNIRTWMISSHGREHDVPDRAMTPEAIAWTQKYHLPAAVRA